MKKIFLLTAITTISIINICNAQATAQNKSGAVYLVVHIDVMPPYAKAAAGLLDSVKTECYKQPGLKSFKVLQEENRPNHFTLLEEWNDRSAYDAFISSTLSRHFRESIQPMLGSPFDERIHIEMK